MEILYHLRAITQLNRLKQVYEFFNFTREGDDSLLNTNVNTVHSFNTQSGENDIELWTVFLYLQATYIVCDYVLIVVFYINCQCIVSFVTIDLHVLL